MKPPLIGPSIGVAKMNLDRLTVKGGVFALAPTGGTKTIHALYSVENNYDQPDHNLVAFWHEKPTLEEVAEALQVQFPHPHSDEKTVAVVKVWSGESQRIDDTDYRLEEVSPGLRSKEPVEKPRTKKK